MQQRAVRHAGHIDAVLLAVQAFGGQQGVQHGVAGLVFGFIAADILLHLRQGSVLLGRVLLGAYGGDLHFQLVITAVDQADILLALAVLLILALQNVVHRRKLAVQRRLAQLLVLDAQNQHTGNIHQRADVVHAHCRLFVGDKAQVAHSKNGQRHHDRHQRGGNGDIRARGSDAAAFKQVQPAVQRTVHGSQQQQRKRLAARELRPKPAVQLPFQAGSQFCQDKGARTAIACFAQVHLTRTPQVQVNRRNGGHHTGYPPLQRHMTRQV